ncbi:MAG TPA: hypothetical protein VK523_01070 [Steroidobacteraceae bacterium]|nr:hypothetical protein [Steroidobacteraceae bacterium]
MSCAISQLILESIRTWMTSTQSIKVLAGLELRWIEVDALAAWPALEEFLAIIFFERQRDISVAQRVETDELTADEAALLISLIVARWDTAAAARCLRSFLSEVSAGAAAKAAARLRSALSSQPALIAETVFSVAAID